MAPQIRERAPHPPRPRCAIPVRRLKVGARDGDVSQGKDSAMTTQPHRTARSARDAFRGTEWIRANKLAAGIIAGALAVIVVAVIVIATGSGSAAHAVPPAKTPAKTPVTAGSTWVEGAANTNLTAVNTAVIALTNARAKGNAAAAAAAGTHLVAASNTALRGAMPPVDAALYRAALGNLIRAGHAAAAGKLAVAGPLINDGIAGLTKVTASADAPKVR